MMGVRYQYNKRTFMNNKKAGEGYSPACVIGKIRVACNQEPYPPIKNAA